MPPEKMFEIDIKSTKTIKPKTGINQMKLSIPKTRGMEIKRPPQVFLEFVKNAADATDIKNNIETEFLK